MTAVEWIRLLRLPNVATAVADVLAGWLVVTQARSLGWPGPAAGLAIAAGACFYAAGMVLNDVFDLEIDRAERPERPLPRGAINAGTAAAVGMALLTGGGAAACAAAFVSGFPAVALVGAALTAAVWFYDRHAKRTPWGPAVMGACRGLNWLLGMTAAGGPNAPHEWLVPVGMGIYVAGITLYARDDAGRSRVPVLLGGAGLMIAGLAAAAGHAVLLAGAGDGSTWLAGGRLSSWLLLWAVLATSILLRAGLGIVEPTPGRVGAAVGNCIGSIITLDAVLVLASCGEQWAIVVLLLLAPFVAGRRLVSAT
jgi:4-hydroxybenzoate polyprenyltransferase